MKKGANNCNGKSVTCMKSSPDAVMPRSIPTCVDHRRSSKPFGFEIEEVENPYLRRQREQNVKCSHIDQIKDVKPITNGCEECLKTGDAWVHLRMCLICGHIGCCDSSRNKHATAHFRATGHPIIRSVEPGEGWAWCYVDEEMLSL